MMLSPPPASPSRRRSIPICLTSTLQQTGITYASAQQFSQGQAVTNAADRMTLARLLSELLKSSGTLV